MDYACTHSKLCEAKLYWLHNYFSCVHCIQVSNNGLILFGDTFTRKRLNALPDFDVPVIAPLWSDFDFRDYGNVYHRASQDQTLLDAVASRIHETNPSYSDFRPTLCLVVTWFRARLSSGSFDNQEVSSTIGSFHVTSAQQT